MKKPELTPTNLFYAIIMVASGICASFVAQPWVNLFIVSYCFYLFLTCEDKKP